MLTLGTRLYKSTEHSEAIAGYNLAREQGLRVDVYSRLKDGTGCSKLIGNTGGLVRYYVLDITR